jgi:hypothetical protein
MHFSPLKTVPVALALAALALPLASHAQVTASLTGNGAVQAGSSSDSAHGSVQVKVDTPLIVTHASAKADLETEATDTVAAAATDERATLKAEANRIAADDRLVSNVTLSSKNVAVTYREPAKFLGLIEVSVPVTIRVDADGSAHVSHPWYGFLLSSNSAALAIRAEALAKNALSASATSTAGLSVAEQARLLNSIHGMLAANAEASATETSAIQP